MLFFDSSSDDEECERKELNLKRRWLRDNSDIFSLPEIDFRKRFRVSKELFSDLLNNVNIPCGTRSNAIPPVIKLATTLKLLATGSYQESIGSDFLIALARNTVSTVFSEVLSELEKLCSSWIKVDETKFNQTKQHCFEKFRFPGIVGFIDGTQIPLLKPSQNEHMYYSRKGYHSINAMVICDHNTRIMAINALYGGAAHDSFVWSLSDEREHLQQHYDAGQRNFWLLGDSGYSLEPWLMTPYRTSVENSAEARYNQVHGSARCCIERCIGVLKGRWRILSLERKCRLCPEKLVKVANVCALLHNMCIDRYVPFDEELLYLNSHVNNSPNSNESHLEGSVNNISKTIRENIKNSLL